MARVNPNALGGTADAGAEAGTPFGWNEQPPSGVRDDAPEGTDAGNIVARIDFKGVAPDDERIVGGANKVPYPGQKSMGGVGVMFPGDRITD